MVVQSRAPTEMLVQLWMGAGVGDGAQGWNADQFGSDVRLLLVRLVDLLPALRGVTGVGRVWSACGWGYRVVGTLLGPEGTDRHSPVAVQAAVWGCWVFLLGSPACSSYRPGNRGLAVSCGGSSSVL